MVDRSSRIPLRISLWTVVLPLHDQPRLVNLFVTSVTEESLHLTNHVNPDSVSRDNAMSMVEPLDPLKESTSEDLPVRIKKSFESCKPLTP